MEPEYLLDSLFNNDKLAPIRGGERLTTPLEELNKYDQGLNRFLDQYDNRAANQTSWDARGNALVQAGAEVLGTTIEGIGYLADIPQYVNLLKGTEAEFGNVFSDIGKSIKEGAREEFGIYGGDGFDPISPRWWAKNAASIASSLSLLIPSMGVVKGAAWLNKITSLSTKAAKTLSGSKLANGLKLSKNTANLEKGLRSNLKGITGAVTSRYMEATMEASGKFDEEFQKGIQQGLSEEEAKLKAGKTASKVWYANQALLLADFFQFKTLFGVNPTKLMNLGKQVVTEGLEEGVQFGFGKEAENSDNVLQLYGNVLQNFPEYFDDPEFLTSITMGAVGGGFFTGMGLATEKIFKKNIEQNKKYEEAVIKGDKTAATEIKDEILSEKTVEELEAYLELVDDADQKIKIQKVIETKKISTQEPTTKDLADQKSKALSKYQLDIENKETSIKELQADKYFQEKLKEFNEGRDTPISPNAFVELLMKSREYSLSSKKLTYRNLFIEDVNEDYDFDLRDDLKKNNGKLVRAVDSLRGLEIDIEKNSDIIDKIDNNPEEAKKDQVKEKVNEIKEQASKLKNVPDLAKLARQAETIEEKEAVNKEIGNKISETREELEDIAFSSNTPEDFINNIPEESKQNTSQEELNEILNQAFPDEDIDLSQMTNVRPAFPEDVKEISGSPKQTIENKPSLAEPKRSNIEDLSDGNPTKGKTQDVRIAFNPKFNKENQELNEEKRKKLQIAGKIEDPVKRKEAIAKINEDYSQISFNSKYVITDQDDKFLAEVLDHYELSKEQYREVIYNIDKYADKPIEFDTFTSRDGNLVGVYLMDGKYPIALAPTFERVVKILEDKGKLKDTKITDSGKVIGNFESVELEVELENLRLLWKYGGKVKLSRTQGGRLRYMKGQYNAVNNFHKLLSDIATDAIIYTPTPKGNVFLNGKGLPAGARMERDSNQSAGRFYLALRDTAGNYRPSRLRTIALHEHEQSFNELKNILGIAEKASIFFKDAKIDKKNMIASMESYLEKNKDKEFYEEAEDWLSNSTEYYETISEYIVKNNKDFYVRTGLIFNGNFFSTKEINGKKVRSFNGLKFLTKKGVVQLNKKVNNLSDLTPQSIENSTSVQIKISRFQETKFNEIADRLETTMKSLEQPFVSPTFFFDLEPNVPSEQVTKQQQNEAEIAKLEEQRKEELNRKAVTNADASSKSIGKNDTVNSIIKRNNEKINSLRDEDGNIPKENLEEWKKLQKQNKKLANKKETKEDTLNRLKGRNIKDIIHSTLEGVNRLNNPHAYSVLEQLLEENGFTKNEINQILDLASSSASQAKNLFDKIYNSKINAEYNAKIAALKTQKETSTSIEEQRKEDKESLKNKDSYVWDFDGSARFGNVVFYGKDHGQTKISQEKDGSPQPMKEGSIQSSVFTTQELQDAATSKNVKVVNQLAKEVDAKYDAKIADIKNAAEASEAEIERRREEVERISKLPFVERIPALKKAGIIASDITYNIGKRFPIILNIAGTKVAFYRSSEGTDGKEKGAWTPMFGYGEDKAGNPWLIKGNVDTQINVNYNSAAIKEYTEILNKTLNWPHKLDKGLVKNHPYFKVLKLTESKKAFNKELYGIEDLGIINRETNVSGFINSKLKEINDKYNAELAALEPSQQASNVKSDFDPALAKKIQDKLEKLYPEIKLVITNTPKWEKGDNVMNQKDYDNQIKYTLKAVNILASDKATQVFAKGKKNGWDLNKILTELQVPKQQKQIILDKNITDRKEIITSLLADNSFTVEIDIAKEGGTQFTTSQTGVTQTIFKKGDFEYINVSNQTYHKRALRNTTVTFPSVIAKSEEDVVKWMSELFGIENHGMESQTREEFEEGESLLKEYSSYNENGDIILRNPNIHYYKRGDYVKITKEEFEKEQSTVKATPTQYYSNLTVPGGTNYTEQNFETPLIKVPKSHAQFNTENTIGFSRSDEKIIYANSDIESLLKTMENSGVLKIKCN